MTGFDTLNTHASDRLAKVEETPMSTPIWQVSDYGYESAEHYSDVINERRPGQVYGRYGGPTTAVLADSLAEIEGAEGGWVFSSGMGAIHSVLMHLAGKGDRIVAARTLYGGTYGLFTAGAERVGIDVDLADATDAESFAEALSRPAAGVFIEAVANPTFEVADIEGIAAVCRTAGVPLVVDSTVPTPALVNPIALGADIVVHATSKYIGGHHDLMGGAALSDAARTDEIRHLAIRYGTTASAFESWLAIRGLATLGLRMQRHCSNAMAVAQALEDEPSVNRVLYPGLPSHPQHERASKLMKGFGGMIAADFGAREEAWRFMDSVKIGRVGSSFGGVRTELTHPASTSHRQFAPEDRAAAGITEGLVRIAVGIEDVDDLLEDFTSAARK
ncbi:MAG: aminotransferase class I/II-fold pyridoxal phosphate-dependent enzyme [Actinobacteria bacterium]|nr:aminotransferase class I/II-fold pyridoxal phosphate-dependent enzyme [Actinomycetota bacterium]